MLHLDITEHPPETGMADALARVYGEDVGRWSPARALRDPERHTAVLRQLGGVHHNVRPECAKPVWPCDPRAAFPHVVAAKSP